MRQFPLDYIPAKSIYFWASQVTELQRAFFTTISLNSQSSQCPESLQMNRYSCTKHWHLRAAAAELYRSFAAVSGSQRQLYQQDAWSKPLTMETRWVSTQPSYTYWVTALHRCIVLINWRVWQTSFTLTVRSLRAGNPQKVKRTDSMTWNKLPQNLTDIKTCRAFKKNHKAHLTFNSVTRLKSCVS